MVLNGMKYFLAFFSIFVKNKMYKFTKLDECVDSIINYIQMTDLIDRIDKAAKVITIKPMDTISVAGPDRSKIFKSNALPVKISISAQTNDPMELFTPEEWGQYIWNVEIKIKPKTLKAGNCFYMQVFIPAGTSEGVIVSWLNQIMIDPMSHTQITPKQCMIGQVPEYQWGTLFMNLYEAFTNSFASKIPMPTVGGLVDDAFVNYCNGPVVFSDFRRLMGGDPWYETFGFYMANENEYRHALANRYTYALAHDSVMENYNIYKSQLQLCRESEPDMFERDNVCKNFGLDCDSSSCPGGSCMLHHREMYSYISEQVRANNPQACQWISDKPPVPSSCLMAFNRHLNSQTMRLDGKDYVVRLKFYTI
jgi:hypothetical protein